MVVTKQSLSTARVAREVACRRLVASDLSHRGAAYAIHTTDETDEQSNLKSLREASATFRQACPFFHGGADNLLLRGRDDPPKMRIYGSYSECINLV
jgi:hypothetical protein